MPQGNATGSPSHRALDVAIIGAGVVGCAIAHRLTHFDLRVAIFEATSDVCGGASRANSGMAITGFDCAPGSLETELVRAASPRWEQLTEQLGVPFRRVGELVVALGEQDLPALQALAGQADAYGIDADLLTGEQARGLVPALASDVVAALHVPSEAIIDPIRLTIAYAESAVLNGAVLHRSTPVTGFRLSSGRISQVRTARGDFSCGYVVNAAGLQADEISAAAGAEDFRMWARKGQFILLDRSYGRLVDKIIVPAPSEDTRGTLVIPTTGGGVLLGPTAVDDDDKSNLSHDTATLRGVLEGAGRLVPAVSSAPHIKYFTGARPASDCLYRIHRSEGVPNLVHAAAIRSTGVSASPAIADHVVAILADEGLECQPKALPLRRPRRTVPVREVDPMTYRQLAAGDDAYKTIVCACEHVSAAEIRDALTSPVPALSLDGVRDRTNATGGRCQGSYCSVGVGLMLSSSCGCSAHAVPKDEPGSQWGVSSD